MRAIVVIVANVIGKKFFQVSLVPGDDVVEQITAAAFHPALGLCLAKILSGSDINSVHTFLSRSICYHWCSCSATSDYGWACSPAACNRSEACSWKISLFGSS